LEPLVLTHQRQSKDRCPVQTNIRPSRLATPGSTTATAIHTATVTVDLDSHSLATESAEHPTGEQIATAPTNGNMTSMGSSKPLLGDDRFVDPRKPFAIVKDLTEVDPRTDNAANRRIVDSGAIGDLLIAEALGAVSKDWALGDHQRG
jgi:hypothetical protein